MFRDTDIGNKIIKKSWKVIIIKVKGVIIQVRERWVVTREKYTKD